jgi:hypothetical protein
MQAFLFVFQTDMKGSFIYLFFYQRKINNLTMEKTFKILVIVLIVLLAINVIRGFFGGDDRLDEAIKKIDQSKAKIDSSLWAVNYSRDRIDSIQSTIEVFKQYVNDIQGRVEILDLQNRLDKETFKKTRDSLRGRLNELLKSVDTTARDLPELIIEN